MQPPKRRMRDCMQVMLKICLKVVVPSRFWWIPVPFCLHRVGCQSEHEVYINCWQQNNYLRSLRVLKLLGLHPRQCSVPDIEFDPTVVKNHFSEFWEEGNVVLKYYNYNWGCSDVINITIIISEAYSCLQSLRKYCKRPKYECPYIIACDENGDPVRIETTRPNKRRKQTPKK